MRKSLCILQHERMLLWVVATFWVAVFAWGCEQTKIVSCDGDDPSIERPEFWGVESHCRGVVPNYDKVFNDEKVHRVDITIDSEVYNAMTQNLNYLVFYAERPEDLDDFENPDTVSVQVEYEDDKWTNVGMRWKGHSSLLAAWSNAYKKLSFVLTFDAFEESELNTDNQRFHGFKRLIFANGYNDSSFIRDKVAAEVFRASGVPVVRSAYSQVYVDFGEGPVYFGIYSMMEDASDKMLESQFGEHVGEKGNLYKPWGDAARWRDPDEDVESDNSDWWKDDIESHFTKSTNDDTSDWSDIMKVIERLHANRNVPEQWRAELEEVFDVHSFIKTLAISRVMMNWDSYGCMHHNYYLYANPLDNGRIVWFPWDLGETMLHRQDETCYDLDYVYFGSIVNPDRSSSVDSYWPLIGYLLADSTYKSMYTQEVQSIVDGAFAKETVKAMMDKYHNLIAPYIVGPVAVEQKPYSSCTQDDCSDFETSLTEGDNALKPHVDARHAAVESAFGGN